MRTAATPALTISLCVAFLAILALLHVLEPEFNPPHLISEYQLGRFGWLMSLAFFSLGGASIALFAAIRRDLHTTSGRLGLWWLLVIGLAYFGAGIFPPDRARFIVSLLHGISGLIVIFSSPIVFTLVSRALLSDQASAQWTRGLVWAAGLAWLGLLLFYGSIALFRGGPVSDSVIVGWTNRFMIATYTAWLITAASRIQSHRQQT